MKSHNALKGTYVSNHRNRPNERSVEAPKRISNARPGYYDETLLAEGKYGEWFWQGISEDAKAFLRNQHIPSMPKYVCRKCGVKKLLGEFNKGVKWKATEDTDIRVCNECAITPLRAGNNGESARWQFEDGVAWMDDAACIDAGSEPFEYSNVNLYRQPTAKWRQFCPECPVASMCLSYARAAKPATMGVVAGGKYFDEHTGREYDDGVPTTNGRRGRPQKKTT